MLPIVVVILLLFSPAVQANPMISNLLMANRMDNINDFNKDQSKKLAELQQTFEDFKRDIGSDGLLSVYTNLLTKWNALAETEKKFVAFMQATDEKSLKKLFGFRLPVYRPVWEPLSSFLKTFLALKDVLDERTDFDDKILQGLKPPKTVAHMRKLVAKYRGKYLEASTFGQTSASPAEQAQLAKIESELDTLEQQLNNAREGLRIYGTRVGLDIEDLNKNAEDMRDMAKDIEDILTDLKKNPLFLSIQTHIVERYNGLVDDKHNPFSLPISPLGTILDVPAADFAQTLADYQQALLQADMKIRHRATDDSTLETKLSTAEARNYFAADMIPPTLDQILAAPLLDAYCHKGYLGYWTQQVVDKLNEIKVFGAPILLARINVMNIIESLKSDFLMPLGAICPDLSALPAMEDSLQPWPTTDQLKQALQRPISDSALEKMTTLFTATWQDKHAALKKRIAGIKESCPALFNCKLSKDKPEVGTAEVVRFRRTQLLIQVLSSLLQSTTLDVKTYLQDAVGSVEPWLSTPLAAAVAPVSA